MRAMTAGRYNRRTRRRAVTPELRRFLKSRNPDAQLHQPTKGLSTTGLYVR